MMKVAEKNQGLSQYSIEKCSVTLSTTVTEAIRKLAIEKAEEQKKREPWNRKIKPNFSGTADEILFRALALEGRIQQEVEMR